jgi:hypothetical protein
MFGLFGRKKREQDFAVMLMKAAAEGQRRALVNAAIGTLGVAFKADPDTTEYCINAVAAIVPVVMQRAGCDMEKLPKTDVFNGSLFAFIYSDHLTRIVGAPFETVASVTLIPLFNRHVPGAMPDLMSAVIDFYNRIAEAESTRDVGGRFAQWISDPSHDNFDRMVASFAYLRATTSADSPTLKQ